MPTLAQGMFTGQHGAWNHRPHGGYKAAPIPFEQGKPVGEPVGVVLDHQGDLLVAVDGGNVVWRVRRASAS